MKMIFYTIILIVLIVLFGTWPLSILAKFFEYLGLALGWFANMLDIFNWNGII